MQIHPTHVYFVITHVKGKSMFQHQCFGPSNNERSLNGLSSAQTKAVETTQIASKQVKVQTPHRPVLITGGVCRKLQLVKMENLHLSVCCWCLLACTRVRKICNDMQRRSTGSRSKMSWWLTKSHVRVWYVQESPVRCASKRIRVLLSN